MNEKLQDLQNSPADLPLPIDRVGIKDFRLPLLVRDRENGHQHTVAVVDMGVDLPADFKGTHMSRFVEVLEHWRAENREELGYASMKRLLEDVLVRLEARKAYIRFKFPYFRTKKAPISSSSAPVSYDCCFSGELERGREKPVFLLQLEVPITTVCPCSKAISEYGAHGQRAVVRLEIKMGKFEWMEEFIDLAEESGSAQIYSLLKRSDEKSVTEQAYEQARFVEDVVRAVADKLGQHPNVGFFKVEVESFESIHAHNAFASIERDLRKN